MDTKVLREAATKLDAAAEHLESGAAAAAFNWGGLLQIVFTNLQALIPILGNQPVPPKP